MKKQTLQGLKKEAEKWIRENPNKTLKDYLEKYSKKEINIQIDINKRSKKKNE